MGSHRLTRRGAVLLAVLAVVVTACGTRLDTTAVAEGNDEFAGGPSDQPLDQPTAGHASTGTATGAGPLRPGSTAAAGPFVYDDGITDREVRIGVTAPLSGIIGFMGDETVGPVDAYFKLVNSRDNGIGGRRLRIISYDDRADPALALANVKRLVEQDKVFMVFGVFTDSALEYVRAKNVPLITEGLTAPPFSSRYPSVFPFLGNALTFNQSAAYALVNHARIKPKRVAVLYDTTIFDQRGYLTYFRQTWERLGAEVVSMDPLNLSDGDCTSLAVKMRGLNIDYWDFEGLGWLLCMPAMDRIDWRPSMGMGGWPTSLASFGNIVGPSIAGVWSGSGSDQPNGAPRKRTEAHVEYQRAIARYSPKINTPAHLDSPETLGMWVAARLVVDGLRAIAPTFTRKALIKWLHGIQNYDVGIQPPIKTLAPNCKRGTGTTWWGHWKWDAARKEAVRTPESPYVGEFWAKDYGGDCFVTKIADAIVRG